MGDSTGVSVFSLAKIVEAVTQAGKENRPGIDTAIIRTYDLLHPGAQRRRLVGILPAVAPCRLP
jgi:hypothetical protein